MRVILIGEAKLAYFLGRQFASKGYQLTIITPSEAEATSLSRRLKATVLVGDGSNPALLESASAYQANVLLALTPQDEDNLVACQFAQRRYGVPRTIALVNDPDNRELFEKLGINLAFSATEVLGSLIEQQADYETIKTLMPVADGNVSVSELALEAESPGIGRSIQDLSLTGALLACVIRGGQAFVPQSDTVLIPGDRVVLVSEAAQMRSALQALVGEGV
ncbi:MAG: NAD-binding protein [Cyanobacteria bacterium P01_A01_bin.135]